MARLRNLYVCQQCGYESPKWFGKCPECDTWSSAVETVVEQKAKTKIGEKGAKTNVTPIPISKIKTEKTPRISTKIDELNKSLGGGLVPGQVVLIAGEPGIGKSTLLTQVADSLADKDNKFLYVSGEESVNQVKIRADRLGLKNKGVHLLNETNIDTILAAAEQMVSDNLSAVVVDSIQTMYTDDLSGMPGSVGQVRETAYRIVRFAKRNQIPVYIVGHVTKGGNVAGPAVLIHIVDTVLWFEGDKTLPVRLLRAVKNRFGPTDEVGIFSMESNGLESVSNPEKLFLSEMDESAPGKAIASIMQGTRPMLVEVQTLTVPTKMAYPKRIAQGIDSKRYELLLAVLTKHAGLPLYEYDCYLNIAGGITLRNDPSADLAVCLSLASSFMNKALSAKTVAIGEVGLLGDVRKVVSQDRRIKEAKRLGYKNIIIGKSGTTINSIIKENLK